MLLVLLNYAVYWIRQPTSTDHLGIAVRSQDSTTAFTYANEE